MQEEQVLMIGVNENKRQWRRLLLSVSAAILLGISVISCEDDDACDKGAYKSCQDKCHAIKTIVEYNDCLYQCGNSSGCGSPCVLQCYHDECLHLSPIPYGKCQTACDTSCSSK